MRITDIHIDGFGVWNGLYIDELASDVTVFFGRNEAGKTTLMQFVRAVLYGFTPERRRLYLPPVHGGEPGGILRVENHTGQYVVERRLSTRHEEGPGRVIVMGESGSRQGQHLLNVLLSGVDESIFENVFAIGIRELQELATLNDTQAAELLYELASGVDRVSLVDVMRHLQSERDALLNPNSEDGLIDRLRREQRDYQAKAAALEETTNHWLELTAEDRALAEEVKQLESRVARRRRELQVVTTAIRTRQPWLERIRVRRRREQLGELHPLPEDCVERLEQIRTETEALKEQIKPLREQRFKTRRALAAQPINRGLWDARLRIQAVCEYGPWIESLDSEIRQLRSDVEQTEVSLLQLDERFASDGGATLAAAPAVSPAMMQQLQPAAVALREATKRRALARRQQKQSRQEEEQAAGELAEELAGQNIEDLEEALAQTGELVNLLRRRVKLDERLELMEQQQEELQQEHQNRLDAQLPRMRLMIGVGLLFVFGWVLLLTGSFGWKIMPMSAEFSWGIGLLGLVCLALSGTWKVVLERTMRDEVRNVLRQRETLDRDMAEAIEERRQLDDALPPGNANFAARLAAAERQRKELESKLPLFHERLEARRRIQGSRRHVSQVDQELREARARWRRALHHAGLPESLTPKQVRQLAVHHQKKSRLQEQLQQQQSRLDRLEQDRAALVERLQKLHEDIGIRPVSDEPQIQISQLAAALAGQQEMVERREELLKQEKELRRQLNEQLQELRRLRRARDSVLAEARVTDEEELEQRVAHIENARELEQRQDQLTQQIRDILAGEITEDELADVFEQHDGESLKQQRDELQHRLRELESHLSQIHQRRGAVTQEIKQLTQDQQSDEVHFELAAVEHQIEQAILRWRRLTMAWHLLESLRATYESERQPETLEEASVLLEQLTEGKYTRVWTPLGRNELRIDGPDVESLPLEVLSRGTREAVFLALRLALVASYGRRGVQVPMILDDVLVNLDSQRAQAAVKMLVDFAADGRQLLFFTCHDHIRELFASAQVDVRTLPAHGTPGIHVAPAPQQTPVLAIAQQAEDETEVDQAEDEEAITLEEQEEPIEEVAEDEPDGLVDEAYEEDEEEAEAWEEDVVDEDAEDDAVEYAAEDEDQENESVDDDELEDEPFAETIAEDVDEAAVNDDESLEEELDEEYELEDETDETHPPHQDDDYELQSEMLEGIHGHFAHGLLDEAQTDDAQPSEIAASHQDVMFSDWDEIEELTRIDLSDLTEADLRERSAGHGLHEPHFGGGRHSSNPAPSLDELFDTASDDQPWWVGRE